MPIHRSRPAPGRRRGVGGVTADFERFVAESGDRLFRLAVVLSADVRAGEDLYQLAMERLATHWSQVGSPEAWTRRVMHNLSVDRHRARQARPPEVAQPEWLDPADARAAEPMDAVEVRPALFEALADLSDAQRLVVALRYLEDRSEADVAALLGMPLGTVKSTASRAVARLRGHPALAGLLPSEEAAG